MRPWVGRKYDYGRNIPRNIRGQILWLTKSGISVPDLSAVSYQITGSITPNKLHVICTRIGKIAPNQVILLTFRRLPDIRQGEYLMNQKW